MAKRKVRRTTTGRRISIYSSGAPFVLSFCKEVEIMEDGYQHWEASGEKVTQADAMQALEERKAKGEDLLATFALTLTDSNGYYSLIQKRQFRRTVKLALLLEAAAEGQEVTHFYRQDTMRPDISQRWFIDGESIRRPCGDPETPNPGEYVWLW
jgi:hypothetical protein